MKSLQRFERYAYPLVTSVIIIIIWDIASGHYPADLLPSPMSVVLTLKDLLIKGTLPENIGISLYRFFAGYLAAAATALPLGLLFGRYSRMWFAFDPIVQLLRPISPIAWLPLIVLWFGIGNLPTMVIVFIAAFFPILLSTVAAVHHVNRLYIDVARNFGLTERAILSKIIIPASFPYMVTGMQIALGSGWVFLVVGEMLGVNSGLGYMIIDGRNSLRYEVVIAAILLIGGLGLILSKSLEFIEKKVQIRWGAHNGTA
ncbi:MAG: ABC transporter permease [Deltaproteobacteria bacterium]|nr:ABC transporter permease [Deltaproteobacteria bacterium]